MLVEFRRILAERFGFGTSSSASPTAGRRTGRATCRSCCASFPDRSRWRASPSTRRRNHFSRWLEARTELRLRGRRSAAQDLRLRDARGRAPGPHRLHRELPARAGPGHRRRLRPARGGVGRQDRADRRRLRGRHKARGLAFGEPAPPLLGRRGRFPRRPDLGPALRRPGDDVFDPVPRGERADATSPSRTPGRGGPEALARRASPSPRCGTWSVLERARTPPPCAPRACSRISPRPPSPGSTRRACWRTGGGLRGAAAAARRAVPARVRLRLLPPRQGVPPRTHRTGSRRRRWRCWSRGSSAPPTATASTPTSRGGALPQLLPGGADAGGGRDRGASALGLREPFVVDGGAASASARATRATSPASRPWRRSSPAPSASSTPSTWAPPATTRRGRAPGCGCTAWRRRRRTGRSQPSAPPTPPRTTPSPRHHAPGSGS